MNTPFRDFTEYVKIGNLQKVIEFIETNQVDASKQNNNTIIWAVYNGHLNVIKYLLTLPRVDISAQDNLAITLAARNGHLAVVEYLLTLPNVDASAQKNSAINYAASKEYLSIVAMLLYYEPKVAASLPSTNYAQYHQLLLSKLRPVAHKIAVSLTEFPMPLIIEVIEQSLKFAIYIPYHIKWNMVFAIKHNKLHNPQ